jgi:Zn-dependent peptidase ImmA (M78 family)
MVTLCGPTHNAVIADEGNAIEIGAEVFAAEFIHSEADFVRDLKKIGTPLTQRRLSV